MDDFVIRSDHEIVHAVSTIAPGWIGGAEEVLVPDRHTTRQPRSALAAKGGVESSPGFIAWDQSHWRLFKPALSFGVSPVFST